MQDTTLEVARERLLDQIFDARMFSEISVARQALWAWLAAHPDAPAWRMPLSLLNTGDSRLRSRKSSSERHESRHGIRERESLAKYRPEVPCLPLL